MRSISSWATRALWVVVAVLAAADALSVPVDASPKKHRRQAPLSPAHSIQEIDKQFAALGSHHQQQHDASGVKPAFRHPDLGHHQPASHPASAGVRSSHPGHKASHGLHKQHHVAAAKHHRVGPKSLHHAHEAQMASSDHVSKTSGSGLKSGGHGSTGKTHEYSGSKTGGGGHGEHHHYQHDRGEDEKVLHKGEYEEGKGAKKHYDHDDFQQSSHGSSGHGGHDASHAEFNRRNKGGFSKGFRDKYHKDEHHKLDKYWSNGQEKGAYEKFGQHNSHHHKLDSGKVKKSQHKEGGKSSSYAKKGKSGKGHHDHDLKGHKSHGGHESQYGHHDDYSKKGGSSSGRAHHFDHGKA